MGGLPEPTSLFLGVLAVTVAGITARWSRGGPRLKMLVVGALLDEAYFLGSSSLTRRPYFPPIFSDLTVHARIMFVGAVSALIIFEIISKFRSHLSATSFGLYVLGVWYIGKPVAAGLNFLTMMLQWNLFQEMKSYYSRPDAWLITRLQFPYTVFDLVEATLITGAAYYLIFRPASSAAPRRAPPIVISYGGVSMSADETTRLLCASALTGGRGFRKKVLDCYEESYRAPAPEVGVDIGLVAQVCKFVENREKRYDWFFLLIGVVAAIVASVAPVLGVAVAVFGFAVLFAQKNFQQQGFLKRYFERGKFDAPSVRANLAAPLSGEIMAGFPVADQNLVVYQGFTPFVGAGSNLGGWSFTVDLAKPRDSGLEAGPPPRPVPFQSDELYAAIDGAINSLSLERLNVRDFCFVNGGEIREDRSVLPQVYGRPVQRLDDDAAAGYRTSSDSRIRHYQWISISDWGNELVMSYFLRCAVRGSSLFVEINRFLLTPLSDACHSIDKSSGWDWRQKVAVAFGSLIAGPVWAVRAALLILGRLMQLPQRLFNTRDRTRRLQIERNPLYNYGAETSIRQSFSSPHFHHYFQKLDGDFYTKVLEHEILDAIVTFLDEHDIDTSEIRERRALILNSGIIVQGGDVTAESLAVGAGATAVKTQSAERPRKATLKAKGAAA